MPSGKLLETRDRRKLTTGYQKVPGLMSGLKWLKQQLSGVSPGFTLLEMSLVVVLIGLIVGGGLVATAPVLYQSAVNTTKNNMDQIEAALVLYVIRNNRLPCPADGALTTASGNYGVEQVATAATGACVVYNPVAPTNVASTVSHWVIPWKTLGIDESYSLDGWSRRIAYIPANPALAGVNALTYGNASGTKANCLYRNLSSNALTRDTPCDMAATGQSPSYPYGNYVAVYGVSAAGTDCGAELSEPNSTTNGATATAYPFATTADTCTSVAGAAAADQYNNQFDGGRAAYVLISHGASGGGGFNKAGARIPITAANTTLKTYNSTLGSTTAANGAGTAGNLGAVQGTGLNVRTSPAGFDDIVRWRSPAFLIQQCGSGACGNP